jgi:hypothetical protein
VDRALRIVIQLPLVELFDADGPVAAHRSDDLGSTGVKDELRAGAPGVIARLGDPLRWLRGEALFSYWKTEIEPRLWDPTNERLYLEEYDGERAWRASSWLAEDHARVVLFEEHH